MLVVFSTNLKTPLVSMVFYHINRNPKEVRNWHQVVGYSCGRAGQVLWRALWAGKSIEGLEFRGPFCGSLGSKSAKSKADGGGLACAVSERSFESPLNTLSGSLNILN